MSEAIPMTESEMAPLCSRCFAGEGLRIDAERLGDEVSETCSNCSAIEGRKLTTKLVEALAYRFFVYGSMQRFAYGAAPRVQFNEYRETDIAVAPWLEADLRLLERILGVGFFHYGRRFWMHGEIAPLKALQDDTTLPETVERILREYPAVEVTPNDSFYRIRKSPSAADDPLQYDSPPTSIGATGRLESDRLAVLYGSTDLQICIHESRVTAEDELYLATMAPLRPLRVLDVSALLENGEVDEFSSLDLALHMLFLAGKHSYPITRQLALAASASGFDGIIYPSYFSLLQTGAVPFQTIRGMATRLIPQLSEFEKAKVIPNLGLFGWPVREKKITVRCINRIFLQQVAYAVIFGPVNVR